MVAWCSKWCRWSQTILAASALLGLCLSSASAADRLRVTGSTSPVQTPEALQKQKELEKLMNSVQRPASEASPPDVPYIPPTSDSPSKFRNKRLEEWIEQRQNWIFLTPDMLNKQMTAEQALGVRTEDKWQSPKGESRKPMERYFDKLQKEQQKLDSDQMTTKVNDGDGRDLTPSQRNRTDSNSWLSNPKGNWLQYDKTAIPGSGKTPESGLDKLLGPSKFGDETNPTATSSADDAFAALLHGMSGAKAARGQPGFGQPEVDFQQLLRPPVRSSIPLAGPNDPVNLIPDMTKSPVQPIIPNSLDEPGRKTLRGDQFGQLPNLDVPNRGRLSAFDEMNVRAFGPSAAPTITTPASTIIQPRPGILPVPRRKF